MNSDTKTNSRRNAGSQAARAIEKLLERIAAQSDDPGPAQQVMADLNHLIEEVRRQYRVLADRQVQAALEVALAVEPEGEGEAKAAGNGEGGDALDALEALIHGEPVSFVAADLPRNPLRIERELRSALVRKPTPEAEHAQAAGSDVSESPDDTQHAGGTSRAVAPADEESDELLFEGMVRLQVYPGGSVQRVLRFVDEMGKRPQFRVLRMSGNPQREGTEIDLGLREPIPLLEMLASMGHAAEAVDGKGDNVPAIAVHLYAAKGAQT